MARMDRLPEWEALLPKKAQTAYRFGEPKKRFSNGGGWQCEHCFAVFHGLGIKNHKDTRRRTGKCEPK